MSSTGAKSSSPAVTIELTESLQFARLSGDFNPLHVDPEQARRLQFGTTVVHGVHVVLAALDTALSSRPERVVLTALSADFDRPVMTGDTLSMACADVDSNTIQVTVRGSNGSVAQSIEFSLRLNADPVSGGAEQGGLASLTAATPAAAVERSLQSVHQIEESLPYYWDAEIASALFPALARRVPPAQLTLLLATTQVVGMACPGLHSIFTRLNLKFSDHPVLHKPTFGYRVESADERFERLQISINENVGSAAIEAFFRPRPVHQAS